MKQEGQEDLMDIAALRLLSQFALRPNTLKFCGADSAPAILEQCIREEECTRVAAEIAHFQTLHPYLQVIAQITNEDLFSWSVAQSYILGSDLLKQAQPVHFGWLLDQMHSQDVPPDVRDAYQQRYPGRFIPFHLYQVLLAHDGDLGAVRNCMVRWGTVQQINGQSAEVRLHQINDQLDLAQANVAVEFNPELVREFQVGDVVAVHWGWIFRILARSEADSLKTWTEQTMLIFRTQ